MPIIGCPGLATETSHTPSLCPTYSLISPQLKWGALKLETILLVCAFNLWAVLSFCDDDVLAVIKIVLIKLHLHIPYEFAYIFY